jgi:GT2 family glycosyltransferase
MDHPEIFVVILNWNLKDDTIACVNSVLAGSYSCQRVVVVDNGSWDGSTSALTNYFGEAIDLIVNEENLGFAKGINVGIRRALAQGAKWVLLLNNDTVIAPDMVEQLMNVADCQLDVGILAPAIFYYDQPDRVWRLGDRRYAWLPIPLKVPTRELKAGKTLSIDYVTGCAMLVKREVWQRIGLLDERFFMYYEDADFCQRAASAGYKVMCVTQAKVWHKVSVSSARVPSITRYRSAKSKVLFFRQYRHGPSRRLTDLYLVGDAVRTWVHDILSGNKHLVRHHWAGFIEGWQDSRRQLSEVAKA